MKTIDFDCPECKANLSAPISDRGLRTVCPQCKEKFTIPFTGKLAQPKPFQAPHMFCCECHSTNRPRVVKFKSDWTDYIWFLFGILPGILVISYKYSQCGAFCPQCGSRRLIPPDTPRARAIAGDPIARNAFEDSYK